MPLITETILFVNLLVFSGGVDMFMQVENNGEEEVEYTPRAKHCASA